MPTPQVPQAVVCFIVKDNQILLMEKTQGMSAGVVNGAGGTIREGETPNQAVVRTVTADTGLSPVGFDKFGEILYRNAAREPEIHVSFFKVADYRGKLVSETGRAKEIAFHPVDDLPVARMWRGDEVFLKALIEGRKFAGTQTYNGNELLASDVSFQSRVAEQWTGPLGHLPRKTAGREGIAAAQDEVQARR